MPWCEDCAKFWNPTSLPPDGSCPTCGRVIGDPPDTSIPWHFWLLLAAAVFYLGWRYVQGIVWLAIHDLVWLAVLIGAATFALMAWGVRRRLHSRQSP